MNQHTLAFGNGDAVFKVPFANAKKNLHYRPSLVRLLTFMFRLLPGVFPV